MDYKGRSLEEIVERLLVTNPNHPDKKIADMNAPLIGKEDSFVAKVMVQRLRGELKKYVTRSSIFAEQIAYINSKIDEIEERHPEIKLVLPRI